MQNIKMPNGNLIVKFDSMVDLADYSRKSKDAELKVILARSSWVGREFKELEQARKAAVELWENGMDVLAMFVERLSKIELPQLKSKKRTTTYSDTEGDEIDMDRMAQGLPYWKKTTREDTTGPAEVTVVIDTTTSSGYDPDDILWRGAAAIALTKILEEKGYVVELWVVNGSYLFINQRFPVMTACCLKKTSDPLDTATLVNMVSGWLYRTITFSVLYAICEEHKEEVNPTLGMCYEPKPADLNVLTTDDYNRIYASGVFSFSAACSLIEAEVARISAHNESKQ